MDIYTLIFTSLSFYIINDGAGFCSDQNPFFNTLKNNAQIGQRIEEECDQIKQFGRYIDTVDLLFVQFIFVRLFVQSISTNPNLT